MIKGRKPLEFFEGKRVYNVTIGKNGRGDKYGLCYLPEKLVGKKIIVEILDKNKHKDIEVVKREYSKRIIKKVGVRR